jgi:nucleoid-associated protein YgaU
MELKTLKIKQTENKEEQEQTKPLNTYTVVKGDTLWGIAKKYYGDGSKYPQIKEKNKAKYSSLSKNNIIYVGWVLEL